LRVHSEIRCRNPLKLTELRADVPRYQE